ncbi:2-amino-4-hydroxy-6-hydroxymethyldihydropteridine diphosphokinase [Chloroflexota bacterium]
MTEAVEIYLGLGSNMGNRQENLGRALALLSQRLRVGKVSSIYDTDPIGNDNLPRFLNMVCQASTRLVPEGLLALVKGIESKLGRMGISNASRPIDIDILLYGGRVMETPALVIPHPRMAKRAFVLVPMMEIAPDTIHPTSGKTIKELQQGIKKKQGVFRWENA